MTAPHRSSTAGLDQAALAQAVAMVRAHPKRNRELAEVMVERGWQGAAAVAAYDCQSRSLNLPPWEAPPCVASVRGNSRAARLLRRMLKRGISRWHPRPLEAIAAAGPVKKKKPSRTRGQNRNLGGGQITRPATLIEGLSSDNCPEKNGAQGRIHMPPIRLTDSELEAVLAAARPLAVDRRDDFLQAVAGALQSCGEIGDGVVHRVCA